MLTLLPSTAALKPTPWISSFLTKPSLTPRTILLTRARLRPCNALASASSPSRLTTTLPFSTLRLVRRGSSQSSLPFGPSTKTFWPLTSTFTLGGMAIGCFPIRDIKSNCEGGVDQWTGGQAANSLPRALPCSKAPFHLLTTRNKSIRRRGFSCAPERRSAGPRRSRGPPRPNRPRTRGISVAPT